MTYVLDVLIHSMLSCICILRPVPVKYGYLGQAMEELLNIHIPLRNTIFHSVFRGNEPMMFFPGKEFQPHEFRNLS